MLFSKKGKQRIPGKIDDFRSGQTMYEMSLGHWSYWLASKLKDLLSLCLKDVGTNLKVFPLDQD